MNTGGYKVSIITASYNNASVIEETILSVLNQTYENIEYIIIDGGSTDGTVDIIKKHANKISYWVSEPDKGISNAWNKGLARCTGDIIGILNADDIYVEDAVSSAVQALSEKPEAGFVFGDIMMCDIEGTPCYKWQGAPDYTDTITYDMPSITHPTVFVRRSIYEEHGGFDEQYKTAMDYEFLLRITLKGIKGIYIPKVLVNMRLGGESDLNFVRGYREVMQASVKYGYHKPKATARFYYKCAKGFIRRILERLGLDLPVKLYRSYFNKWYKY